MEEPCALGSKSENPLRSQPSQELLGSVEGRNKPQRNKCVSPRLTWQLLHYFRRFKTTNLGTYMSNNQLVSKIKITHGHCPIYAGTAQDALKRRPTCFSAAHRGHGGQGQTTRKGWRSDSPQYRRFCRLLI